ncbi:hypothetical protein F2Q69_00023194 [Brassica cretica]|uniref:Uncharacterized protein n=1 Tax=Brassica cretica TaxID=69181 RepID=A0A8S9QGJ9_BRACR|nr:hypothetical protein F2Q69_00023194 [Brassica cretica]
MVEASSQAPESTPSDNAPACVAGFLSFREKMARRKAEKEPIHVCAEPPSSPALVVIPVIDPVVQAPQDAGEQSGTGIFCVLDASAQPSGPSTTPIVVDVKEKVIESIPPPQTRKEIVLALRAPSATPAVPARSRKRRCTMGNDGEPLHPEGSSLALGLRGKFVSLIDGMSSECGSEVGRLARDLTETQGKLSESEAMLKAVEDSHSAKVSKIEVQIGELERDLGKTVSSSLKEKKARKTKSSEVRRLQRQIESGEGSTNRGIEEAKDVLHLEFQTRLAKISDFLGSLECIRSRDLALATIDGGMAVVQALQGETPSSLEAKEARFSACKGGLAAVDGSFDLILADLKSECFLPMCSEDPEEQKPAVGETEAVRPQAWTRRWYMLWPCMAMFMFWDWPLVAFNPYRSAAFHEWMISLRLDIRDPFREFSAKSGFCGISEDVKWQDLGLLLALGDAMTNSTYVSRYSFDLIPYRLKVRDRFSAYMTVCLESSISPRTIFKSPGIADQNFGFFYSAITLVSDV